MDKLILNPTDLAQWQALVDEAQSQLKIALDETLESYLVFLLMRFATQPEMTASVLGLEYLQSYHQTGQLRDETLRNVGDKCLLFSGLFPGQAKRRQVKISYFVDIGQSAYGVLSNRHTQSMAELYSQLRQHFVALMEILQTMRECGDESQKLLPLEAAELFLDTGSGHALNEIRKFSDGTVINLDSKSKKQSH